MRKGKVIIIGASQGLGRGCALEFLRRGWTVGAMARNPEKLHELEKESDGAILTAEIDITSLDSPERILAMAERMGGADLIFLTAGIGWSNPSLDLEKDLLTVRTDVEGFMRVVNTSYHYFADRRCGGQVAAISSIAGTRGIGISASYSASKAFDDCYMEALGQLSNLRGEGITFTTIRPGFVRTALLDSSRKYPMLMEVEKVVPRIVSAIIKRKSRVVVNRRWAFVTALWNLIPHSLWRRLKINL